MAALAELLAKRRGEITELLPKVAASGGKDTSGPRYDPSRTSAHRLGHACATTCAADRAGYR